MVNDTTSRNYPLPHPENIAKHDAQRIRESFIAIDTDINKIDTLRIKNELKEFEEFIGLWSKK